VSSFVEIDSVTHAYGGQGGVIAVDKLTLSIAEGEFAAVVGPSGCGKSTLMKLVTGLQLPQVGSITVGGAKVVGPLKIAGMAFQAPSLLPWRSTLDNILLPLEIVQPHRKRLRAERGAYVAKVETLLTQVGLAGLGAKYPWELSGRMQQRASLCRALLLDPPLLLMDEPFGALDAMTRDELNLELLRVWGEGSRERKTIVFVTHSIAEAAFLADRVVVMTPRPGRVARIVDVPLPRPRTVLTRAAPEFGALTLAIHEALTAAR